MSQAEQRRNRLVLLAIAALFFIPLLLASLMQSRWWHYEPADTTNRGTLVQPPVPLDLQVEDVTADNPVAGQWQMAYPLQDGCDGTCRQTLTGLRQVHRASGRHQDSVVVSLYSPERPDEGLRRTLSEISPRFVLIEDPWGRADKAFRTATQQTWPQRTQTAGAAFLIDPQGHIILAYAPGFDPNDLHADLKKLLKFSSQD